MSDSSSSTGLQSFYPTPGEAFWKRYLAASETEQILMLQTEIIPILIDVQKKPVKGGEEAVIKIRVKFLRSCLNEAIQTLTGGSK